MIVGRQQSLDRPGAVGGWWKGGTCILDSYPRSEYDMYHMGNGDQVDLALGNLISHIVGQPIYRAGGLA